MGRKTALRAALQGGADKTRRNSDAAVRHDEGHQRTRREDSTDDAGSRKRDSGPPSWDVREPAKPRDASPATRPPSVRQRQGGGLDIRTARRRSSASSSHDGGSEAFRTSADASKTTATGLARSVSVVDEETTTDLRRGAARSPAQRSRTKSAANNGREVGSARGGNNQADDLCTAPARRGSSTVSNRAASSPSGSPYLEPAFQSHVAGGTRRGRSSVGDGDHNNNADYCDGREAPRRSGGGGSGSGDGGGGGTVNDRGLRADGYHEGRGGRGRPPPSTAPSAIEADRLPSIDGLDVSAEGQPGQQRGGGDQDPSLRLRRDRDLASSKTAERCRTGHHKDARATAHSSDRKERGAAAGGGAAGALGGHDPEAGANYGGREASGGGGGVSGVASRGGRRSVHIDSDGVGRTAGEARKGAAENVGGIEYLVGLQNLGNTCFMNACLQCLLHTDILVDFFRRRVREQRLCRKSPTEGALAEAFGELIRAVEASPAHSSVSPAQVCCSHSRGNAHDYSNRTQR